MKIFVTGATGFIGTHLARRLINTEHEMRCLVRETSDCDYLNDLEVVCVYGDVVDRDSVQEGMQGCDWVIHLANIYSFWEPDKQVFADVNIKGTRNVLECALEMGIAKVVHVSTSLTYGKPADHPFTEESPVGPEQFSEYARTKYLGDCIAWELYEEKGLPLVVVYPAGVMGKGDDKASGVYVRNVATGQAPAAVFTDSPITWVHVRDVAEVIVRALEKEDNIGEKYLVGKTQLTFGELNDIIHEITGAPLPRFSLPDTVVLANAALLTSLSNNITHRPPPMALNTDQVRTMKEGLVFDGSKVERELDITYTPIRTALKEAIASYDI
jgi:dihydroflavonol-4-reductase